MSPVLLVANRPPQGIFPIYFMEHRYKTKISSQEFIIDSLAGYRRLSFLWLEESWSEGKPTAEMWMGIFGTMFPWGVFQLLAAHVRQVAKKVSEKQLLRNWKSKQTFQESHGTRNIKFEVHSLPRRGSPINIQDLPLRSLEEWAPRIKTNRKEAILASPPQVWNPSTMAQDDLSVVYLSVTTKLNLLYGEMSSQNLQLFIHNVCLRSILSSIPEYVTKWKKNNFTKIY